MNKPDLIEKQNRLAELKENNVSLKSQINGFEVKNAIEDLPKVQELEKTLSENSIEIIKIENELNAQEEKQEGKSKMTNFIESQNAVTEFFDVLKKASGKSEIKNAWNAKLAENGVTITDTTFELPRKLVESINTALLDTNPVFKVFRVTNVGALLVSRSFDSSDEAQVHKDGQQKVEQSATLTIDTLEPVMVYKLQSLAERVKRLQMSYSELYNLIVAELTQAIVNKIVDLALFEGDGTNGFKSVDKEADAKKIKKITTKAPKTGTAPFADAIEEAVDFVRATAGRRYLIVTAAQRKTLLDELRGLTANAHVRIKNDDTEIASEVGVDEIIVYTGSKAINPIVLVDQKYHIDMQDLTKVDAFEWKTNSNMILVETLSSGKTETLKAGAVITITGGLGV
jgi:HK97 family phage major capsid protein|nr:MAG TPA: major capsid protein [Caudoviricetes sp.]